MSSAVDPRLLALARERTTLALFTALAVAVHVAESLLPLPAPWFRLGLANALTVTALLWLGHAAAWKLTLMRVGLGALILGRLFAPGFFLSLGGGLLAVATMSLARRLAGDRLGPVGVSVVGAAGHALGQLLVAWALLLRHPGVWLLFPPLLLTSLVAGILTGLVAGQFLAVLARRTAPCHQGECP